VPQRIVGVEGDQIEGKRLISHRISQEGNASIKRTAPIMMYIAEMIHIVAVDLEHRSTLPLVEVDYVCYNVFHLATC
jgi:hypothetical protein